MMIARLLAKQTAKYINFSVQVVRKLMIDMVLSTDMVKHTNYIQEFRTLIETLRKEGADENSIRSHLETK